MPRIPFALQSYRHPALQISAQRLVNWYPEVQPPDAKAKVTLLPTPGLSLFATVGDGPLRGMAMLGDNPIVVSATEVYSLGNFGTATLIGTIADGATVRMAEGRDQLVIVVPETGQGYYTDGSTVTEITSADYPGARDVAWIDGYWVFVRNDSTGQFFLSEINDPATYDALDFATAEGNPDPLLAVHVDHREVLLFGPTAIEVWTNTGAADFPFERVGQAYLERGTASADSIAGIAGNVFFLGNDNVIYALAGYQPRRISTHAIERAIAGFATTADAMATTYEAVGHTFYALTFPTAGYTFVYDVATQAWHERRSAGLTYWRCGPVVRAFNRLLAADISDGAQVWQLLEDTYTENSETIEREAVGAPVHADGARAKIMRLEVEMQGGVGLTTGQGSDPQAMLSWSDDGGMTWGNELWRDIGAKGEYKRRVEWRRLGQFREGRVFRLRVTDPVQPVVIAANFDVERGAS